MVKGVENQEELMAEINITPFTDVLLVLLIIFMITATAIIQNGFNINLPKAVTHEEATNANIVVSVTKDGKIFVGEKEVSEPELLDTLKELKKERNTDRVIILADGTVYYSKIIAVMDKAKEAELTSIALATDKDDGGGANAK
jgi:biopolymer transport protein ExbD